MDQPAQESAPTQPGRVRRLFANRLFQWALFLAILPAIWLIAGRRHLHWQEEFAMDKSTPVIHILSIRKGERLTGRITVLSGDPISVHVAKDVRVQEDVDKNRFDFDPSGLEPGEEVTEYVLDGVDWPHETGAYFILISPGKSRIRADVQAHK